MKVRLSGELDDIAAVAALITASGVRITERGASRPNRREPGFRVYLTTLVSQEGAADV